MAAKIIHVDAAPDSSMPHERAALTAVGLELVCAGAHSDDEVIAAAHDADVIITDHVQFNRALIERIPRCLAILRTGTGYDSIDVTAATEHGIIVTNFPAYCTDEVANHAMMFILACAKRLIEFDSAMRRGNWPEKYERDNTLPPIGSVTGEHLGIVGLGRIGKQLAVRAQAFGMTIRACDPYVDSQVFAQYGARQATLDEILETSDYISLHTPLTEETRCMIGAEQLRRMKPSAFLINTSRGKVVDQDALAAALAQGEIAGAALDVYFNEPPPADSPLLQMPNVIFTPHVAGRSDIAFETRLPQQIGSEAARVATLQWPETVANPEVRGRSRLEERRREAGMEV